MFTYNESDGTIHFAKPLNENGNNVINEKTGHTVFSNPTRKILYALTSPEGEWICAMDYQYANAGTTVTRKNLGTTPHTGFTFNQAVSSLAENNVVQYDEDPIVAYAATDSKTAFDLFMTYYSTIEGNLDVFENTAQHRYVYQMAKNIDEISDETTRAARIEEMMPVLLAYKKQASLEIKDKYFYPQYPNYLPYGMSADLGGNFALVYHKNNYAITNVADWNRLVANCNGTTNYLKNYTFHLTDDIVGTSEEPVESVAPYFNGVLDGHGFTITLDINEVHTTGKDNGLIVQVGEGAIIKNLGLKGSVNVRLDSGVTSGDYGIGALAGTSSANAKLIGCWNEATVTVTLAEGVEQTASNCNTSVGGLAGRWYGQIYDCYNVGAVTGLGRASGICNWMNGANGVVYNVFNSGTLTKSATDKIDNKTNVIYRGGNVAADTALSNIYALEGTTEELANSYTTVGTSRMVAAATYSSGELAYLLNSGKKNYTAERTYFTLNDENQTVLGPAETQIRKIIVKDSSGSVTSTKYGAQGSDYSVGSGTVYKTNKNHYTNGSFIVPDYDLTLTAASQASLSQYISLYNYWNGKRAAYFDVEAKTDLAYDDFETQIRRLETAYNNGLVNVTSMAALELDAMTTLQGQYRDGDVGMPHAYLVEAHPDAPVGYRIHSAEDMHALAEYTAIFNAARASGKETILKMVNNVDMALYAGEPFYINGLDATFDGNNKTIFNFTYENLDKDNANIGPALFRGYIGSGISNLTIDGLLVSGGYAVGGLLGNNYSQYVQLNNVTMRNSRVRKAFVAKEDELAMGMLVGRIADNGGVSSIKDCVVEDCILDFTLYEQPDGGDAMINVGFITGQTYENTILDGVVCQNNTILLNGHEKDKLGSVGYLVGEAYLDSDETLNVRNTTVYGNNTITDPLVTDEADMLYGLEANTKQNQYKYGEVLGWLKTQGAVQISNVQIAGNDANAKSGRSPMLV
ncbi:MAG: hypothetical protein IJN82_04390, partial [Clostridia bacterium]|nr:hypothetical protein [Clostridia bacterium]